LALSYARREVENLLDALEDQLQGATRLAKVAERDVASLKYSSYRRFREKVGEFLALTIIIKRRIPHVDDVNTRDLVERFEMSEVRFFTMLVRASLRFFYIISSNLTLPMGTREIFLDELRSLHSAHETLRRPEYALRLDDDVINDLDVAEQILTEIVDRAPRLLMFEA
jgi:hypothetical protein